MKLAHNLMDTLEDYQEISSMSIEQRKALMEVFRTVPQALSYAFYVKLHNYSQHKVLLFERKEKQKEKNVKYLYRKKQ